MPEPDIGQLTERRAGQRRGRSTGRGGHRSAGRRRDRLVYLASHPLLFTLLAATRRAAVRRLGRTVLVHGERAFLDALCRVPLDRTAAGTTGGAARHLVSATTGTAHTATTDRVRPDDLHGLLFDQDGAEHRAGRRRVAVGLGSVGLGTAGVAVLRPIWSAVLNRRLAPLAAGGTVDVVDLVAELVGATTAALLGLRIDPLILVSAARDAAASAARAHLPGPRWTGRSRAAGAAAARLTSLLDAGAGQSSDVSQAAMLAVAAINTTIAAIPRAVAWCADDGLWPAADHAGTRSGLVSELLRVTAPTPILPRVAAATATVDGRLVRARDRLILVARHAAGAHRAGPDPARPAPPAVAQLVFGAGPHACPGAHLARAQLDDVLAALAPYRPVVTRSRVDRRAALPGWSVLTVRALRPATR